MLEKYQLSRETSMKYSIIVAVDNEFALINNFIENLLKTTDIAHEGELVIVLDGCSDIKAINYLKGLSQELNYIKLIENPKRYGYSIANNIAVKNSCGEVLLFINSDVFPTKGSIEKLVNYVSTNQPKIGAAQGLLIYPQNNTVQSTGHLFLDLQNTHVYQGKNISDPVIKKEGMRQALTTAFCAIPRDIFFQNNMLNEYYYNAYEGFELTFKISLAGLKCMYYPEATAYHICGGSRSKLNISETQQSKYFIQHWGEKIETDIEKYIRPQLNDECLNEIYTVINLSQLKGWKYVLDELNFHINGEITQPHSGEANLYLLFPYSFLNYAGNYLFITDSYKNLMANHNWFENRFNNRDIVIDSHGNFEKIRDLIK